MPKQLQSQTLFNVPWLITKHGLANLVAIWQNDRAEERSSPSKELARYLKVTGIKLQDDWQDDDDDENEDDKEYSFPVTEDGIAVIPMSGPLTKASYWFGTSYGKLQQMCVDAMTDPAIAAVLLCCDSPGGEAASSLYDLSDYLFSMRGAKPFAAISDDACYSAAYWLASAAPKLFVNRAGGTGSIGVWAAHVSLEGMLKKAGIDVTYIFSGEKKVDGNQTEPLSDRARADMQENCDRVRDLFVQAVARNRGVSADALYKTEAGMYMAEKGMPLLADAVGNCDDAIEYLRGQLGSQSLLLKTEHPSLPPNAVHALASAGEVPVLLDVSLRAKRPGQARGWADHAVGADLSRKLFRSNTPVIFALRLFNAGSYARVARVPAQQQDSRRIEMLVVPYETPSGNLGGFREIYQRGCFADGLDNDPRILFNHDENCVLGRKSAGTASFWEDATGVHCQAEAPETQWADDLIVSMQRGDINQASAAFWILQQRWEMRGGEKFRIVEKALLREGSVHSFAAYESTRATVAPARPAIAASHGQELDLALRARAARARLRLSQ